MLARCTQREAWTSLQFVAFLQNCQQFTCLLGWCRNRTSCRWRLQLSSYRILAWSSPCLWSWHLADCTESYKKSWGNAFSKNVWNFFFATCHYDVAYIISSNLQLLKVMKSHKRLKETITSTQKRKLKYCNEVCYLKKKSFRISDWTSIHKTSGLTGPSEIAKRNIY